MIREINLDIFVNLINVSTVSIIECSYSNNNRVIITRFPEREKEIICQNTIDERLVLT